MWPFARRDKPVPPRLVDLANRVDAVDIRLEWLAKQLGDLNRRITAALREKSRDDDAGEAIDPPAVALPPPLRGFRRLRQF